MSMQQRDLCPMILALDTIAEIPFHERSAAEERDFVWTFSAPAAAFSAIFRQQQDL